MKAQHPAFGPVIAILLAMLIADYFTRDEIARAGRATWSSFAEENGLDSQPGDGPLDYGDGLPRSEGARSSMRGAGTLVQRTS